jgi:hypothetical protein
MKGFFRRTFSGFEPVDDAAKRILKRYQFGETLELENTIKRNVLFHRKFFAMINLTFHNQDITKNENDFREAVTIAAGFYHYQKQIDMTEIKRADSISFSKMDDISFENVYNKVFDVCLKILGCKSEELESELLRFD